MTARAEASPATAQILPVSSPGTGRLPFLENGNLGCDEMEPSIEWSLQQQRERTGAEGLFMTSSNGHRHEHRRRRLFLTLLLRGNSFASHARGGHAVHRGWYASANLTVQTDAIRFVKDGSVEQAGGDWKQQR